MRASHIRRGSAIPLYFQLQELLKEQIEAGAWLPGEMIPSEAELCETYGVSRPVVRQALSVLEQDGQLRRVRGRGTFVRAAKIEQRVGGLSRLLAHLGPGHEVRVIDHRKERAAKQVGTQLGLGPGASILRVMSLLSVDDAPVALFDSFFPVGLGQSVLRKVSGGMNGAGKRGTTDEPDLARTTVAIETSFCSQWESEQLQIPLKGAVFVTLCTEFQHVAGRVRPCEVVRGVYRVDRVQLRFDVGSDGEVPTALWEIAQQ